MGLFDWLKGKPPPPAAGRWKPASKEPLVVKPPKVKPLSFEELPPEVLAHAKPGWKPVVTDGEGEAGASRFGGRPGLMAGEQWPACGGCGAPMPFFFQMNLAECPGSFGTGLLQFFYCLKDDGPCFDIEAFGKNRRVRIVDPKQVSLPESSPSPELFPARRVTGWTETMELPNREELQDLKVTFTEAVEKSLEDLNVPCGGDKLGGWPAWVQGVEYPSCPACGKTMRLLFQIDSEDNVPYMWGDVGAGHITRCPDHPNVLGYVWACC